MKDFLNLGLFSSVCEFMQPNSKWPAVSGRNGRKTDEDLSRRGRSPCGDRPSPSVKVDVFVSVQSHFLPALGSGRVIKGWDDFRGFWACQMVMIVSVSVSLSPSLI